MATHRLNRIVATVAIAGFTLGVIPLCALILFSPGLGAEGLWAKILFVAASIVLVLLCWSARTCRPLLILAVAQLLLLIGVVIETLNGSLYVGT
jgi:hypothetical protein